MCLPVFELSTDLGKHLTPDACPTRDVSLNEAAALLPSVLLPPQTDLSALADAECSVQHGEGALVGGTTWGHSNAPTSASASSPFPLSLAPCSYGHPDSDYRMWSRLSPPTSPAYSSGGLNKGDAFDDVRAVGDAMGWRYPQHNTPDVHHKQAPDEAFVDWGRSSCAAAPDEVRGMWGGFRGDAAWRWESLWGSMGSDARGSGGDDKCELEVIAAASRSSFYLLFWYTSTNTDVLRAV